MIVDEVALGLIIRGVQTTEIKERIEELLKTCGPYQFRNGPISASILALKLQMFLLETSPAGQDL